MSDAFQKHLQQKAAEAVSSGGSVRESSSTVSAASSSSDGGALKLSLNLKRIEKGGQASYELGAAVATPTSKSSSQTTSEANGQDQDVDMGVEDDGPEEDESIDEDLLKLSLVEASRRGLRSVVARLLAKAKSSPTEDLASFLAQKDHMGNTAVHAAAMEGFSRLLALLLHASAPPDLPNFLGETPLLACSGAGHAKCVSLLLDAGANVLHQSKRGWNSLQYAAWSGNTTIARLLLEKHANANIANNYQLTPLHYACMKGDLNMILLLLRHGANYTSTSQHGSPFSFISIQDTSDETPAPHEVLQSDLGALLKSGIGSDLTLVVEDQEICVHKAILAARSSYFREKLASLPSRLEIEDASLGRFRGFLLYVYTAQLDIPPGQALTDTLEYVTLGHRYGVESLVSQVNQILAQQLDSTTLVQFLTDLKTSQVAISDQIKIACAKHFFRDINAILSNPLFPHLGDNIVTEMLHAAKPLIESREVEKSGYPVLGERGSDRMDSRDLRTCNAILRSLVQNVISWAFIEPVDPIKLGIPTYFDIIKEPMDLGTIQKRLDAHFYVDPEAFANDIRLTFNNAQLFNPPDSNIHSHAVDLLAIFEKRYAKAKWSNMRNGDPSALKKSGRKAAPVDPVFHMTHAEKYQLGLKIQQLPEHKLPELVKILKDGIVNVANLKEEARDVEIDLEKVDDITLQKVEQYVTDVLGSKRKTTESSTTDSQQQSDSSGSSATLHDTDEFQQQKRLKR